MISFKHKGNFKNTERFFINAPKVSYNSILEKYGAEGVAALSAATPKDSGETSMLWSYEIKRSRNEATLSWTNSNMAGDTPVVILIQYGHGTGNGAFVKGNDFINPVLKPIFDKIASEAWREVLNL